MAEVVEVDPADEPMLLLLKLATLTILQRDHPDRRTVHTWTEPGNAAMYRTNVGFGFVAVERMHEMQRKDGG